MSWTERCARPAGRALRLSRGLLRRADAALSGAEGRLSPAPGDLTAERVLADRGPEHPPLEVSVVHGTPGVTALGSLHPGSLFGGTATQMALSATIARDLDRPLRVVETLSRRTTTDVVRAIRELGVDVDPARTTLVDQSWRRHRPVPPLELAAGELVVTSAWWDTSLAARLPGRPTVVQLVQDDERIFSPLGDTWLAAERTYRLERTLPVFNTELLRRQFLEGPFAALAERGVSFEPAVLRALPGPPPERRLLVFYARPHVERNLFTLGLDALDRASTQAALAGWDLAMAGDDSLGDITLAGGQRLRNLGKLPLADYRRLLGRARVALSPMLAPHPNYPTLEFAQAGARVVTTAWGSKRDLSGYGADVAVVEPEVEALSRAVLAACEREEADAPLPPPPPLPGTWQEAFAPVIARLRGTL